MYTRREFCAGHNLDQNLMALTEEALSLLPCLCDLYHRRND